MANPTPRASLLSGLRTGGVRSTPNPYTDSPDPSSPIPSDPSSAPPEQQRSQLNPHSDPFSPSYPIHAQAASSPSSFQALQMQMMQLEIWRLQSLQAQHFQTELLRQQSTTPPPHHPFDLRSATLRRITQAEQLKSIRSATSGDLQHQQQQAMTAAIGGKFATRLGHSHDHDHHHPSAPPPTPFSPAQTTVISGGTCLGTPPSSPASKSDAVSSWRRTASSTPSALGGHKPVSPPRLTVTPPPVERWSSTKNRPIPLTLSAAASRPLPAVAVAVLDTETTDSTSDETASVKSSEEGSSPPTTPPSDVSEGKGETTTASLSPREEATRKLYEGLGVGRRPSPAPPTASAISHRLVSQPFRQPRGPPSGADELGPKNFATRIRRRAIGGLGALMGARERRDVVEAY